MEGVLVEAHLCSLHNTWDYLFECHPWASQPLVNGIHQRLVDLVFSITGLHLRKNILRMWQDRSRFQGPGCSVGKKEQGPTTMSWHKIDSARELQPGHRKAVCVGAQAVRPHGWTHQKLTGSRAPLRTQELAQLPLLQN